MVKTIYTIGYAGFSVGDFVKALHERGVSVLVDVRSFPFSGYYQDYNKDQLEQTLRRENIYYRNYAREFGARQTEQSYYPKGYLDFELFAQSPAFQDGVRKVENSMEKDFRFALMCAEIEPIDCHRAILVARAFAERGYEVIHLRPKGPMTQQELEALLLDRYFSNRNQFVIGEPLKDEKALLEEAYRLRNEEIGYHTQEDAV